MVQTMGCTVQEVSMLCLSTEKPESSLLSVVSHTYLVNFSFGLKVFQVLQISSLFEINTMSYIWDI